MEERELLGRALRPFSELLGTDSLPPSLAVLADAPMVLAVLALVETGDGGRVFPERHLGALADALGVGADDAARVADRVVELSSRSFPGAYGSGDALDQLQGVWLAGGASVDAVGQWLLGDADVLAGHSLIWYENRRTPEVVKKGERGEKGGAGTAAGKVVKRRDATEEEERMIARGDWVRVTPSGKKPSDPGYKADKRSKVRPKFN